MVLYIKKKTILRLLSVEIKVVSLYKNLWAKNIHHSQLITLIFKHNLFAFIGLEVTISHTS